MTAFICAAAVHQKTKQTTTHKKSTETSEKAHTANKYTEITNKQKHSKKSVQVFADFCHIKISHYKETTFFANFYFFCCVRGSSKLSAANRRFAPI